jgi:DNA-binding CsgD family transcriptional regulator
MPGKRRSKRSTQSGPRQLNLDETVHNANIPHATFTSCRTQRGKVMRPFSEPAAECQDVPSAAPSMCQNLPSAGQVDGTSSAEIDQNLPDSAENSDESRRRKTNPPRPLSYAQHAAIRLMVRGHGSVAIARHLGLNHHTIGRWKRDVTFVAEVERLRAELTTAALAVDARASTPPSPPTTNPGRFVPRAPLRSTRDEDAECEALIARVLGRGRH